MSDEMKPSNDKRPLIYFLATLFTIFLMGALILYVVTDIKFAQRIAQPLCDLNSTQQLIAYGMIQDTNQHQIIINTIISEQQCNAFMSKCKLISVDYNAGTQTIVCPQGGG